MGLDMYIRYGNLTPEQQEAESYEDWKKRELCYWRKHPNLHGYIVKTFARGEDECQQIPLTVADVQRILKASQGNRLPKTDGFFFGQSQPSDKADTKVQLEALLTWMADHPSERVYYQASW